MTIISHSKKFIDIKTPKTAGTSTEQYLSFRGRKLSSVMLKMALNKVCTIFSEITLIAYILPDNMASYKALARAGFQLESEDTEKYTFIYECT